MLSVLCTPHHEHHTQNATLIKLSFLKAVDSYINCIKLIYLIINNMETERLKSLDMLRGFDLFCLLFFQPILINTLRIYNNPSLSSIQHQFQHVEWQGFAFWDLIMPLFMFMSGITIPFALSKYKSGNKINNQFYLKIIKRFCWLFFLGWIVQGNLLALDIYNFHIFANTLQAIAIGYIISALIFVHFSLNRQIIFCILFFLTYIFAFAYWGDFNFSQITNLAEQIDRFTLGRFRDGVIWENGIWRFNDSYSYTWILSSCNFIVTVMLGMFAGTILRKQNYSQHKRFLILFCLGCILILAGLSLSPIIPIIKRIWSSSMTLYSAGICFVLISIFYFIIDIKKYTGGKWLMYYGTNSIVAYCIYKVINFKSISNSLFFGLEQWMGDYYSLIGITFQCLVVFTILRYLYRLKIFIKV